MSSTRICAGACGTCSTSSETFRNIATYCKEIGVEYLTVYAFSTENWNRPQDEVDGILNLLRKYLDESCETLAQKNARLRFLGRLDVLPDDIREKIELQGSQSQFKVKEANRRLAMATKNVENAEENLRCANLGFKEGVLQTTDVMAAQTAWLQAQSQKIDAEIDVKLSQVNLKKALGVLE